MQAFRALVFGAPRRCGGGWGPGALWRSPVGLASLYMEPLCAHVHTEVSLEPALLPPARRPALQASTRHLDPENADVMADDVLDEEEVRLSSPLAAPLAASLAASLWEWRAVGVEGFTQWRCGRRLVLLSILAPHPPCLLSRFGCALYPPVPAMAPAPKVWPGSWGRRIGRAELRLPLGLPLLSQDARHPSAGPAARAFHPTTTPTTVQPPTPTAAPPPPSPPQVDDILEELSLSGDCEYAGGHGRYGGGGPALGRGYEL